MSAEIKDKKPRKAPAKKKAGSEPEAALKAEATPTTGAAAPKPRTRAASTKAKTAVAIDALELPNVRRWATHEEIASLAHRFYEERGSLHGFHEQDWYRAEQELSQAS